MILKALCPYRLKCSEAHIQGDFGNFHSAFAHAGQYLRCEVQACRRSCNSGTAARKNSLVALAIDWRIVALDIEWERNMPQPLDCLDQIARRCKFQPPQSVRGTAGNFRL